MSKLNISTYIKNFFLKKRPILDFPFLFFSALSILSFVCGAIYRLESLYLIGWSFILFSIIWLFIYLFVWNYFYSEDRQKVVRPIPKKIEDIKFLLPLEAWDYLNHLDNRVKVLEKTTPLRLGTYALLFSVLFAIALSLIFKF